MRVLSSTALTVPDAEACLFKYSNWTDFQNYNIMRRNQSHREQQFVDPFQEAVWYVEFQGWSYESQDLLWLVTAYAWPS